MPLMPPFASMPPIPYPKRYEEERKAALKEIKVVKPGKPMKFTCKYCQCEYECPVLACDQKYVGGYKIHWWSSKRTQKLIIFRCVCPECKTTNEIEVKR
ncbi:MAG: hypothetical protein MJZ34_11150 [Paludibacteraceae bacterium]|nr:hypothetical protein [Paludibacteraceae bacterium]